MTQTFPIEGWAAVYGEADYRGDIVLPGAFTQSLTQGASAIKLLYQHVAESPIGRWLSFEDRAHGLYAKGELFLATQCAREAAALVEADIIDGLSIGYRSIRAQKKKGQRFLVEADLWEVSVVTFPMAPRARLLRRSGDNPEITAFADHLRKAAQILSA